MRDYGREADTQRIGYFFVYFSLCNECQHLGLAVGENFLLDGYGHGREVFAMRMTYLLKGKQMFYKSFFGHTHAEAMKIVEL